jgi:nitrate reductase assembly molybdenum cofactor insertion protein NarJ
MTKDYSTDDIDDKLEELQNLEEISDSNKDLLTEFIQYLRADSNVSCQRQYKYLYTFKTLLTSNNKEDEAFIHFDLEGASKDDMRKAVGNIQASSYSEWSKRDMKVSLKKLFRTTHEEETERPKRIKKILNAQFMKTGKKIENKKETEALTPEEVYEDYVSHIIQNLEEMKQDPYIKAFESIKQEHNLNFNSEKVAKRYVKIEIKSTETHSGVKSLLSKLSENHRIGILTNGDSEVQKKRK